MYKTLRRGEGLLQYRVVGSAATRRRRRRHRLACLLVISTAVGAVTVAAAVIVPVVLTANLVALPAGLRTLAVSTKHGLTRYIAVLPVREAKFKLLRNGVTNDTDWRATRIVWKVNVSSSSPRRITKYCSVRSIDNRTIFILIIKLKKYTLKRTLRQYLSEMIDT